MASKPSPSPDLGTPEAARIVRSARPLTDLRGGHRVGAVAGQASRFARHLGVAAGRREGAEVAAVELPWGVWPRRVTEQASAAVLGGALASYARLLERRRAPRLAPVERGLPLLSRRAGATSAGPHAGPGGLVRSMVPVERQVPSLESRTTAAAPLPRPRGR